VVNRIRVAPAEKAQALLALERMFAVSPLFPAQSNGWRGWPTWKPALTAVRGI